MSKKKSPIQRIGLLATVALMLVTSACHREVKMPPVVERNITLTDKFFDVWPVSEKVAFIVGARGKMLYTEDGGLHFTRVRLETDVGIFGVQMVNPNVGYICGQDGLIMRTQNGGRTWERINSRTHLYLFGLSFADLNHGMFVGDRSVVLSTSNGGESLFKRSLQRQFPEEIKDYALGYMDPVLYSVNLVDPNHGWIVGELGRIWATEDGGQSWTEQQNALLDQWKRPLGPNDDRRFRDFFLPTLFSVSFRDQKRGAACGLEGWVIATSDGGKTWAFQHQAPKPGDPPDTMVPGEPQDPARDPLFSVTLWQDNQAMATGLTGTVLRLQPNGAWAHDPTVPQLPFPLSQVRFYDADHGWIVGYGTILYTEDGGKTWRMCQG